MALTLIFQGISLEALKYIYEERKAAANGHETMDTDSSAGAAKAGDLVCERYVLSNHKLQVEVLTNLDKVSPAGAVVIVSYPRIEGATGLKLKRNTFLVYWKNSHIATHETEIIR